MTTSFFFSPRTNSGFTWGVGPVFETPSSYQPTIGSGHYSIGPTGVVDQVRTSQQRVLTSLLSATRFSRLVEQEALGQHGRTALGLPGVEN